MNFKKYIDRFQIVAGKLDKDQLNKKQLEVAVGEILDSVYLKLYKISWTNSSEDPLVAETRIFFSVWINDSTLREQKIFYNIHAFKLRNLKGYSIESRKFADSFRAHFKPFEDRWQNVSLKFGPLTLMEGWIKYDEKNLESEIIKLADNFLAIEYLIDKTLIEFRKR